MGIFKSKLSANEIEGKIKAFDEVTSALELELGNATQDLEKAYIEVAESEVGDGDSLPKTDLKKLRDKKFDLEAELAGRGKVSSKLKAELHEARRREELQGLQTERLQAEEAISRFEKETQKFTGIIQRLFTSMSELKKIESKVPGMGFGYPRSSEIISQHLTGVLKHAEQLPEFLELVATQKQSLLQNLSDWYQKQESLIESKHDRIKEEAQV